MALITSDETSSRSTKTLLFVKKILKHYLKIQTEVACDVYENMRNNMHLCNTNLLRC